MNCVDCMFVVPAAFFMVSTRVKNSRCKSLGPVRIANSAFDGDRRFGSVSRVGPATCSPDDQVPYCQLVVISSRMANQKGRTHTLPALCFHPKQSCTTMAPVYASGSSFRFNISAKTLFQCRPSDFSAKLCFLAFRFVDTVKV